MLIFASHLPASSPRELSPVSSFFLNDKSNVLSKFTSYSITKTITNSMQKNTCKITALAMALIAFVLAPTAARAQEAYAVESGETLTFYYDNNRSSRSGTIHSMPAGTYDKPSWAGASGQDADYKENLKKAVFDASFTGYKPTSLSRWFYNCRSLESIEGIEYLNTEKVTAMNYMFYYCIALTTLDLSSFDTSNVTVMNSMFDNCTALTSLNISSFDTSNVTNMCRMFYYCLKLTAIDVSGFDTSNVTDMQSMFANCKVLTTLDLTHFSTANVSDMRWMFNFCSKLKTINCNDTWSCGSSDSMFLYCSKLKGAVPYDESKTDVSMANPITGYFTGEATHEPYAVSNEGSLTFYYDDLRELRSGTIYPVPTDYTQPGWYNKSEKDSKYVFDESFKDYTPTYIYRWFSGNIVLETIEGLEYLNTSAVTDMSQLFYDCSALTSLDLTGFDTSNVTNMNDMFSGCWDLTSLDLTGFDTSNVTSMNGMFSGCWDLTSLDLTGFDTSNVTSMSNMFSNCLNLTSLDLTGFDTSNVTTMADMFRDCTSLTSLDVSGFDTSNVTDMADMFYGCSALTSLDLSGFDTSNVTDMSNMFITCYALTSLDLSGFDTSNVTDMADMFRECHALTSLDLSGFDTSNVTDMSNMFTICSALTSLDLTGFDTSNVTDMADMFRDCTSLTSLDLSGFDTSNVTDMAGMFGYCWALNTIYCDDTWTCDSSENMFYDCVSLVGAVPFDASKVDVSMANPLTGYFTKTDASVTDINADESLAPTEIYNLQGIRMQAPLSDLPTGIYIAGGRKVLSRR